MTQATRNLAITSKRCSTILIGTLAVIASTAACSQSSRTAANTPQPAGASLRPAAMKTVSTTVPNTTAMSTSEATSSTAKAALPKLVVYKSRNYGVSFSYPRQYASRSARAIANGDLSLQPKPDGYEGQITLARIEIPKGFYPDTDYQSGYFTLSLNEDINADECRLGLNVGKEGRVETMNINGTEFQWIETDTGGRGNASKVRNYVAYANETCYELETGVRTNNEGGLARELDPDQVLRRLDAILTSVSIIPATENPVAQKLQSSVQIPESQK
jgi:hypothetical protein